MTLLSCTYIRFGFSINPIFNCSDNFKGCQFRVVCVKGFKIVHLYMESKIMFSLSEMPHKYKMSTSKSHNGGLHRNVNPPVQYSTRFELINNLT